MNNNKTVYLIGNGPSLNEIDVAALKNDITISFNRAYIAYEDWGFDPTYYMIIDIRVLENIYEDVNRLITHSKIKRFFIRDVDGTEDWNHSCFSTREHIVKSDKVTFITTNELIKGMKANVSFEDMGYFGDVSVCSLQVLYLLGYKRVLVLGCDANYEEKKLKGVKITGNEYVSSEDNDLNHFRPDYFGKGTVYSKPFGDGHFLAWIKMAISLKNGLDFEVYSGSKNSRLTNRVFPFLTIKDFKMGVVRSWSLSRLYFERIILKFSQLF
ncbi:MAG: hypothetical protein COA58_11790 [Bacteroidetes bacterium]|nr:MAG: hypothetical protein COA58_11790 [Bacteroidota bacterium]